MQNVNKVIGLLNEKAPTNHFLAYINPKEANVLKSMGGSGIPGPFGIPSFIDFGDYDAVSQAAAGGEFGGGSPEETFGGGDNNFSNGDDIDSTYTTGTEFNVTPVNEPSVVDNVVDFFTSGGVIGNIASNIFSKPENQYAGITGEDGIGEGDYVSTLDDFAESRLGTDYASLDSEQQQFIDQEAFNADYRSPSFQSLYDTGDLDNLQNLSQPESDAINQLVIQAPFAYGNQTPIESQVAKYFENLGNQQGLSTKLENDYNTAKTNVQNTLNITPLQNQFGYSATPFGNTTTANLYANAFNVPYLQQRGLI
jgi:hypothetical protein